MLQRKTTSDRKRIPTRTEETYLSQSEHERGGHWKSKSKKQKSIDEDDLSQPWLCEETDPFTPRIRNFEVPKRTCMPTNVNSYDGTGEPEDHLKIFQATAKIERWAMPTWCHMLNSTLIGSTRVWFDTLPLKSINSYVVLRKAFLGSFLQQKKYIKDPAKIHHIKQKEGETTKAFMERFKAESIHINGALKCMRSVDEMMSMTTTFLRGEATVANQSRKKAPPTWKNHETPHKLSFDKRPDFKNRHKSSRRHDRFTPLVKPPKEIIAMDTVKFKAPPPMSGLAENRNKNKLCEFHGDKGYSTNECIHLKNK
ncbi:reverse transcriptase domain-containing protein [Tanacetum coccineum]